jgi:hypothetical protein
LLNSQGPSPAIESINYVATMIQDRLTKAVLRRFKELGLPPSVLEMGDFRESFYSRRWVMFVRDGDKAANVHLVQPRPRQGLKRIRHRLK